MKSVKRVINIVDNLDPVNAGIWKAAVSTAEYLINNKVQSELWAPHTAHVKDVPDCVKLVLLRGTDDAALVDQLEARNLDKDSDVIVTHGCWRFPSKWGKSLRKLGFTWVYTPQGMLEPWALSQKRFKKSIYLTAVEKPYVSRSSAIRAVSTPELHNLKRMFPGLSIVCIPNGVQGGTLLSGNRKKNQFVFMSRLHEKKGVTQLVRGWQNSAAANREDCSLIIAGPDQGELQKILPVINKVSNIQYVGAVYGAEKEKLLSESAFFVLPSYSEGFPTALLEAMNYGLVPLISKGCNLPEAFENGIAISAEPNEHALVASLELALSMGEQERDSLSKRAQSFVQSRYTLESVAIKQLELFNELLNATGI